MGGEKRVLSQHHSLSEGTPGWSGACGLQAIHTDLLWSQSWTAVGANEILIIGTPRARSAGTASRGSLPVPCPKSPFGHSDPGCLGQRPMLAYNPSPELAGQGIWGAACLEVGSPELASERPGAESLLRHGCLCSGWEDTQVASAGAQQSLGDKPAVHQEACPSDSAGLLSRQ